MIGFENITTRIEQINSLAYALEGAMIEAAGHGELVQLAKDADELNGHIAVCNAVYAVNHVDELKAELAQLKQNA